MSLSASPAAPAPKRQYVNFVFYQVDPAWRRLPEDVRTQGKQEFLRAVENADLVIGSRYKTGVNVINWPISRLLLSLGANQYARWITGMDIMDSTGGFKCFRRPVLQAIDFDRVRSNGYAFQIEMSFRAWKKGFRLVEIPIVFTDRVEGQSKMNRKIVREAIWMVWWLRLRSLTGAL